MKNLMAIPKLRLATAIILWMTATVSVSWAQQGNLTVTSAPRIENAKVETRAVGGTLAVTLADAQKSAVGAEWVGYAVKLVPGERTICCGNYNDSGAEGCGRCELETARDHWSGARGKTGENNRTVKLEGGDELLVLFRLQDHRVIRIRLASSDCVLDAGGLPFVWLTDVKLAESVAVLAEFVRKADSSEQDRHSVSNEALTAIALHDGREAEAALEGFTAASQPEELRKQASFWLGAARGKDGFLALQGMAKNDPSTEVRAQVAFALSVSKEPAALDEMIHMAHQDPEGHVRGQAIFWLAQKAGKRAIGAIDSAIENDPDTEVKKKAVFALSQLPKDEGVPKLISVAESNRNPAVRKQAMFWLGQSQDPRALEFFEKVLAR
jgi:hypothetical protein